MQIRQRAHHAQLLKLKLGITAWREFSQDMKEGWARLRESPMWTAVEEGLAGLVGRVEGEADKVRLKASEELQKGVMQKHP